MRRADDQRDPLATESTEEFVSFAREYFAGDFPNPERKGCPPRTDLEASIQSRQLPDDALRQHLFGCSQCFSLYQQLRETQREAHIPFWQRASEFIFAQKLILGPVFAVLVVAGIAVVYFTSKTPQHNVAEVDQTRGVGNADVSSTVTPSPEPAATQHEPAPEAVSVARVDLRDYTLRRGNESSAAEPLRVKQGMIAFSIMLPEGSPAGSYSVSLLDAFGKTLRSRGASSPDGKKLSATLNLSFPENQTYRLCVSRANEPPNCYPIVITKGR